ncbi:MAG: beta-lactamase family protein [Caldilineaceae bacterium]|nr:beta-lactamase family protein [Caldilineaceae bacterium]
MSHFTPEQTDQIHEVMTTRHVPGLAVSLVKDGEIRAMQGFGVRDLRTQAPMTAHTVAPICSLTKSFTALAVMQLVEAGKLSLDTPVTNILPDFALSDATATAQMTPRTLLSHRSGLGRTGHQAAMFRPAPPFTTRAELVALLKTTPLQSKPHVAWAYSNESYVTASHLVDRLSLPIEQHFAAQIFAPLGLQETSCNFHTWRAHPDQMHTYLYRDGEHHETALPADYQVYVATGGICSSIRDLARVQMTTMDYATHPLLSAGSLEQMHTVQTPYGDTGWGYGLGWEIAYTTLSTGLRKVLSHSGGLPGVNTFSLLLPQERLGIALIANKSGAGLGRLAESLLATVLGEPLFRPTPDDPLPFQSRQPHLTLFEQQAYTGDFQCHDSRMMVSAADTGLTLSTPLDPRDPTVVEAELFCRVGPQTFLGTRTATIVTFLRAAEGAAMTHLLMDGDQFSRVVA